MRTTLGICLAVSRRWRSLEGRGGLGCQFQGSDHAGGDNQASDEALAHIEHQRTWYITKDSQIQADRALSCRIAWGIRLPRADAACGCGWTVAGSEQLIITATTCLCRCRSSGAKPCVVQISVSGPAMVDEVAEGALQGQGFGGEGVGGGRWCGCVRRARRGGRRLISVNSELTLVRLIS